VALSLEGITKNKGDFLYSMGWKGLVFLVRGIRLQFPAPSPGLRSQERYRRAGHTGYTYNTRHLFSAMYF
jgi:hypothetical protein